MSSQASSEESRILIVSRKLHFLELLRGSTESILPFSPRQILRNLGDLAALRVNGFAACVFLAHLTMPHQDIKTMSCKTWQPSLQMPFGTMMDIVFAWFIVGSANKLWSRLVTVRCCSSPTFLKPETWCQMRFHFCHSSIPEARWRPQVLHGSMHRIGSVGDGYGGGCSGTAGTPPSSNALHHLLRRSRHHRRQFEWKRCADVRAKGSGDIK